MANVSLQLLFLIFFSKFFYFDTIKLGFCHDGLNVSCIEIERRALLEFKSNLSDPSGILSSWKGEDCCQWRGVSCNMKTKHVIGLNLHNSFFDSDSSALGGKISSSLLNLKHLSHLDLSMNDFSKTQIPSFFGSLQNLRYLNLSGASLYGSIPQSLGNLSNLQYLDLSQNNFQGVMPDELSKLSALEKLDLSFNYGLEGKLSRSFGKLCNLTILALTNNNITGNITDFISGLSKCSNNSLETLDLRSNKVSGSFPEAIGSLTSLKFLYLSDNQMSGNITKNLGKLSSLIHLDLFQNLWEGMITEDHLKNLSRLKTLSIGARFLTNISLKCNISPDWVPPFKLTYITLKSCPLGPEFPKWLKNQTELSSVMLKNVGIAGTIPDWFMKLNLQLDQLDISHNQLSGEVPNSLRFTINSIVDLSSNLFKGLLPLWSSNVSSLYLSNNLFSGPIPSSIDRMPNLGHLDISWNFLNGSIPMSLGNLTRLENLIISSNRLSGKIPYIWEKIPYVQIVDMSNNNLTGTIPSSMGNLSSLDTLDLSGNNLSGELPSNLGNCTGMNILDLGDNQLSGNLPAWIGESMPSLSILQLRNNSLMGNIPLQFCNLSFLHILDLSKNVLSGTIPSCIGNLIGFKTIKNQNPWSLEVVTKGMTLSYDSTLDLFNSIDLSDNSLSGEIPAGITSLLRLNTLNLSMNHLTGKIPSDIGSLKLLETLDLSRNQLSGPIPISMASLTLLNHLNLSYNNLSGYIPTSNQFESLDDPSIYKGNAALCGIPLRTNCSNETTFNGENIGDKEDDDELDKLKLFVVVGSGFFLGFWGVCGTLIIKKRIRYAYFHFLQRMQDKICQILTFIEVKVRRSLHL